MNVTRQASRRAGAALAVLAAGALALTACNSSSTATGGGEDGDTFRVAVLLSSSQNGYNQAVGDGVQDAIDEIGGDRIETTVLDGGFNADTQLSQMETAGLGDQYDGIVVVPFDGPALAAAFPLAADIPVTTVLNPIGPELQEMEPQVEGVVSTVSVPAAEAAAKQAEGVITYCADIDPCKIVLLVGQLNAPLDVAREAAYREVLEAESNIEIVQTVEGNYDPDQSSTVIANVLQANPDINGILSNGDQMVQGAQIALEDAGIDPASVYLQGGGGAEFAIENLRAGVWTDEYINFPRSMGRAAMEQLYNAMTGADVESYVNADEVGEVPAYVTKDTIAEYPEFTGEWAG